MEGDLLIGYVHLYKPWLLRPTLSPPPILISQSLSGDPFCRAPNHVEVPQASGINEAQQVDNNFASVKGIPSYIPYLRHG